MTLFSKLYSITLQYRWKSCNNTNWVAWKFMTPLLSFVWHDAMTKRCLSAHTVYSFCHVINVPTKNNYRTPNYTVHSVLSHYWGSNRLHSLWFISQFLIQIHTRRVLKSPHQSWCSCLKKINLHDCGCSLTFAPT